MTTQPPSALTPARTGWRIINRKESGLYVAGQNTDTLFFRFDPVKEIIYCWDKKTHTEVAVPIKELTYPKAKVEAAVPVSFGVLSAGEI